ncbi:MAG TPA: hypothetical protein VF178_03910 [Gemmatimonadaceae bacterium]
MPPLPPSSPPATRARRRAASGVRISLASKDVSPSSATRGTKPHAFFRRYIGDSCQEIFLAEVPARGTVTFNLPENAGGYVFARPGRWNKARSKGWFSPEQPVRVDVRCDPI